MTIDLLVSVRDSEEARFAADAGVPIIDVKDPANGPLGFAGESQITAVQKTVPTSIVSAALGELVDWHASPLSLARPLNFAKFGLAGMSAGWCDRWQSVTDSLGSAVKQWVAVAYADFAAVEAPAPEDVLCQLKARADILLVDTYEKNGVNSIQQLGVRRLQDLRQMAHESNLRMALAGQLAADDLDDIVQIQPDILAVRGAVCVGDNRKNRVNVSGIRELQSCLQACCGHLS